MSTETEPADLSIPPAAVEAYFVCGCSESGVRAGYRPEALAVVVAAELRRLADEDAAELDRIRGIAKLYSNGLPESQAPIFDRHHASMMCVRARADQLDPKEA